MIIYVAIIILGTFIDAVDSNQSMCNIVSWAQILTLANNIVDHGNNKLITIKCNVINSNKIYNCTKDE